MFENITEICPLTQSCINFKEINNLIIEMVSKYYFDLQMYANFVFDIDNDKTNLSDKNNFYSKIVSVKKEYQPQYPRTILFSPEKMESLEKIVKQILVTINNNRINAEEYLDDIDKIEFFGSGVASSAILLKIYRQVSENKVTPLIIKLIPFQLPHQYQYLPFKNGTLHKFINRYIESPGYALYIKEAWMYCFSKNELLKYTPTFTCIANCYIINGFPIWKLDDLAKIYKGYAQKRLLSNKALPYKKWFNILIDPNTDVNLKQNMMSADYGCFEMRQIEGTLDDLENGPPSFDLSIIFEYLYTKIVAAFIGRIIFTDDHFGNVAYRTVDYTRLYKIKCNGCNYFFYMPPGKPKLQFDNRSLGLAPDGVKWYNLLTSKDMFLIIVVMIYIPTLLFVVFLIQILIIQIKI